MLQVQFHDVKGSDLEQWKTDEKQTILWPDKYATGKAIYPYSRSEEMTTPLPDRGRGRRPSA